MKIEVSTLVTQYYELGGKAAEEASPKLDREQVLALATGTIPSSSTGPNLRALRTLVERRAQSELGIKLELRASTLDKALEKLIDKSDKPIPGLDPSSPTVWTPARVNEAVQQGHLATSDVAPLLGRAYLGLLTKGDFGDAIEFKDRFHGSFEISTSDAQAATALAVKTSTAGWAKPEVITSLNAMGLMSAATYAAAMKGAYLHALGHMWGHFDDASRSYTASLQTFAPYENLFTVSDDERHAAMRSLIRGAADWGNTAQATEVTKRLDFIAAHRSPGDEDVMAKIFAAGAEKFVGYGDQASVEALEARLDMVAQQHLASFAAALNTANETAKKQIFERLGANNTVAFGRQILSLLRARDVITADEFSQGLSKHYELERSENSMQSYWNNDRTEGTDRDNAKLDAACRAAAKAVGVTWEPPAKAVRVHETDIAPVIRDADYAIDTPQFAALRAGLVDFLPPNLDQSGLASRFGQFLEHAEIACTDRRQTWTQPSPRFAALKGTTRAELTEYALAIGAVIGDALGKTVTLKADGKFEATIS